MSDPPRDLRHPGQSIRSDLDAETTYEALAIGEAQAAADLLRPVYDRAGRGDGYVGLEVPPALARDAATTIAAARRLWARLDRENVLIRIPATPEALPAIRALLSEGINVEATLLASRHAYDGVAKAHLAALEARADRGEDLSRVACVASLLVSPVDTLVDGLLDHLWASDPACKSQALVEALRGRAGMANAKLAHQDWLGLAASPRWTRLRALGAMPQRLLCGSAGATLEAGVEEAQRTVTALESLGISLEEVGERLLAEGLSRLTARYHVRLEEIRARRVDPARQVSAANP